MGAMNNKGRNKIQNNQKRETVDYMLPSDSTEFIKKIRMNSEDGILSINPYLAHNHFYIKKTIWDLSKPKLEPKIEKSSLLFEELRKKAIPERTFCNEDLKDLLKILDERTLTIFEHISKGEKSGKKYSFKPAGAFICGAGGGSPYGNIQLLTLHHIYGIPYIPASMMKGTLRACWIVERFEGDEKLALNNPEFRELFGSAEAETLANEGNLVFFDIFPQKFSLALEVQTSHFPDYYCSGKKEPTDDQSPVPIFFTCMQDAELKVYLSCREKKIWDQYKLDIDEMMKRVFMWYGIGAKTALGYGME